MSQAPDPEKKDSIEALLRELGAIVPGKELAPEPALRATPDTLPGERALPAAETRAESAPASHFQTAFSADLPAGPDLLGFDETLARLAALAAHKRTETPLTIGFLGPPGSGKSFAIARFLRSAEALSARAETVPDTPYLSGILTLSIDAAGITENPAESLAGALHARLAEAFPKIAAEAACAVRDPRADARESLERLDECRRKLEAEKQALDEVTAQRARLSETILYESAGSQTGAFISANKEPIRRLFTKLKIPGDPLIAFKDMTGALLGSQGFASRAGFALRSLYAFKGQRSLLFLSLILALAWAGLRFMLQSRPAWLGWRESEPMAPMVSWLEAHQDLMSGLGSLSLFAAVLAGWLALWRMLRLSQLMFRSRALLEADTASRARELDGLIAHKARRIEGLAADASQYAKQASEAEKRAGSQPLPAAAAAGSVPFPIDTRARQARAYAAAVGAMAAAAAGNSGGRELRRIIVAIDHLDTLDPSRSVSILNDARRLFQDGYALVIAADPARLGDGSGKTPQLGRWIQIPVQTGALSSRAGAGDFIRALLEGTAEQPDTVAVTGAAAAAFGEPLPAEEARLLAGLAPLAGVCGRDLKRFVNLYRLLRAANLGQNGALALMLALEAGGTAGEREAVQEALSTANPAADFAPRGGGVRLSDALLQVQAVAGRVSAAAVEEAAETVRVFSLKG
jgi:hypothetical protein